MNSKTVFTLGSGGSLTMALRLVLSEAGRDVHVDDLHAALGLSWSCCAVATEPDMGQWPSYARDAFLPDAAADFGCRVRELHPPESAIGLHRAEEFEQHFDVSYRPLIHRALEHRQPVLAWRGWEGDAEASWGVIRRTIHNGCGFVGTAFAEAGSNSSPHDATLIKPAVQVYVVEEIAPIGLGNIHRLQTAAHRAIRFRSNETESRFGMTAGPRAIDVWRERLEQARATSSFLTSHAAARSAVFARSVSLSLASASRFIQRCDSRKAAREVQIAAKALADATKSIEHLILPLADESTINSMTPASDAMQPLEQLAKIQTAMSMLNDSLIRVASSASSGQSH